VEPDKMTNDASSDLLAFIFGQANKSGSNSKGLYHKSSNRCWCQAVLFQSCLFCARAY